MDRPRIPAGIPSPDRVPGPRRPSPEELAQEYEPSAQTIRTWVHQDQVDTGERPGLTSDENAELAQLRREVKEFREEKEILRKARFSS
ncbi:hypothetical protein KBY17_19550 [Streptomyces sp. RK75]|nr:hypothetical protein [Streptomyces sp. RK75]